MEVYRPRGVTMSRKPSALRRARPSRRQPGPHRPGAAVRPGRSGRPAAGPQEAQDLRRDLPADQRDGPQLFVLHARAGQAHARHPDHRGRADEREEPCQRQRRPDLHQQGRGRRSRDGAVVPRRRDPGQVVPKLGTVMKRQGRARIVRLDDRTASAKIENGCGGVAIGDYLLPFEEEAGEMGKDQGYGDMDPNASKRGRVVYIEWRLPHRRPGPVGPDRHGPPALRPDRRPAQRLPPGQAGPAPRGRRQRHHRRRPRRDLDDQDPLRPRHRRPRQRGPDQRRAVEPAHSGDMYLGYVSPLLLTASGDSASLGRAIPQGRDERAGVVQW
ncbi:MAG: hypothetical protein MZU79_03990 [Anaerotruncus sp.]|nr:hypothetical protein [Anaerotruncus sp.]